MKECEKILSKIHLLAEGELDSSVTEDMIGHIDDCDRCSAELEKLRQFKTVVEGSLAEKLVASDVSNIDYGQCPVPSTARRRLRLALKWTTISMASAAVIVAVVAVGYLYRLGFIGPKPVAARHLHVSTADGQWTPVEKKIRGMTTVSTREQERRSIRLESGVMVVLNGKTSLEIMSASLLSLQKGDIYVDTAGQKGLMLRIKTAHADTIVTGTKLGVSTEGDQTSVVVEEGKVTVGGDWGEQIVVRGSIFSIIESMKPEPPQPADVEEIFFWVQERARIAGMMLALYEDQQEEPASIAGDEELLGRILYGLGQSRDAVWSADVILDTVRYTYGQEITEEERKQYIEHVIEGHISQLDSQATPAEEDFKKTVLHVLNSSAPQSGTHTSESTVRWIFDGRDRVRKYRLYEATHKHVTEFVMNGDLRYFPQRQKAERSTDGFPKEYWWNPLFPAYFGRCPVPISDLLNPRLLRTEEINGIETYVLEADLPQKTGIDGGMYLSAIQLWVEPDRGYLVHKVIEYTDVFSESMPQGTEFIAESFVEVSPGVYFPQTVTRNIYMAKVYSGERYLQKKWATVYTLRETEFNGSIPIDTFDLNIPPGVEITEYMSHMAALRQPESAATEEYLEKIYDELEEIRLYDDPSAPGSRKLVFRMDGEKLGAILRETRGGVIWAPAQYNRNIVGWRVARLDPAVAAELPYLPGDIIYTLNDEPWKVRSKAEWMRGMEGCTIRANSGLPITAGVRRNGELIYVILWLD
jgi:hypothetical protein